MKTFLQKGVKSASIGPYSTKCLIVLVCLYDIDFGLSEMRGTLQKET